MGIQYNALMYKYNNNKYHQRMSPLVLAQCYKTELRTSRVALEYQDFQACHIRMSRLSHFAMILEHQIAVIDSP